MPSLPPELLTQWLQPGALVAGAVGGLGLLISAFRNLRTELKEEMRAGEDRLNKRIDEVREEMRASEERVNRRIDEVKEEMREVKQEMKELKALLIQALQLSPAAKP
ncbi:MAG: hypothetical protein OXC96_10330 [Cyanobacteria bacterium MAG CAR1_bin_15]|nr:hypothetical protein [Cyanobacteria bacterium MAG CAR1_bin_15]